MKKITIFLLVSIVIILGLLSGCAEKTTSSVTNIVNPVNVDIISRSTRTGYEGINYVVYVDVTAYNRGGEGKATVWVSLSQGGNQWSKNQAIYLNQGETRDLTFSFPDVSFWSTSGGNYRVWVE